MLLWNQSLYIFFFVPILYFVDKVIFRRYYHNTRIIIWKLFLIRICIPIPSPITINIHKIIGENIYHNSISKRDTISKNPQNIVYLLSMVLVIITLLLLVTYFVLYFKSTKELAQSLPLQNLEIENMIKKILKKPYPLLYTEKIDVALTYGIIHPKIVIPQGMSQLGVPNKYVICHECMHIKNHDNFWKFFSGIMVCVYWFNPLIWLVYFYFDKKIEFCCDENVLIFFEEEVNNRKQYAENLLFFAAIKSRIILFQNLYAKTQVKERIVEIMKFKNSKKSFISTCAILFICSGILTVSFQVSASESQVKDDDSSIKNSSNEFSDITSDKTETRVNKFDINDENLNQKIESLERNELSEEEAKAVIDAFHDRNRRIIAEWERNHQ